MRTSFIALFRLAALAGCEREGPLERAGESADRTIERAGDKVENATDRK
jgi:predicted small lipoprotein YifL